MGCCVCLLGERGKDKGDAMQQIASGAVQEKGSDNDRRRVERPSPDDWRWHEVRFLTSFAFPYLFP